MSASTVAPGRAGPSARPRPRVGPGAWLAFGLILAFLLLFLIVPVGTVIYTAFVNETGSLTVGHFANFFGQLVFRESFFNSLGVALASTVLAGFTNWLGAEGHADRMLTVFHATFICMGGMTLASAWIFWQLSPQSAWVRRMVHDIGPD